MHQVLEMLLYIPGRLIFDEGLYVCTQLTGVTFCSGQECYVERQYTSWYLGSDALHSFTLHQEFSVCVGVICQINVTYTEVTYLGNCFLKEFV